MKCETRLTTSWLLLAVFGALLLGLSLFPTRAEGQQGNNAVYNAPNACCHPSPAFIDASVFASGQHPNICTVLNYILNPTNGILPAGVTVIDARGLSSSNTNMTCAASPWAGIANPPPSTILLPAGTIVTPHTWVLPNNTTLIREGDSTASGTTIQAKLSFVDGDIIDFGAMSIFCQQPNCTSISVKNLTLDGQGQSINGIVNLYAQTGSRVDHVRLYQIRGTGLLVSANATDSGPYSNITFDTGGYTGLSSTVCAQILGLSGTRGIQGLTCISENNDPQAAVLLDSSNNSLEDVRIVGFYDGIRVGANANAQSNVLVNIIGDTNPVIGGGTTPIIVVHITNHYTVSDLSIMGANNAMGGSSQTITIQDDLTGAQLTDTSVGIYALGEKDSATGAYSRYTTSPSAVTWAVGSGVPSGTCARGSLYSCIGGNSGCQARALWDCLPSVSTTVWTAVK